MLEQVLRRGAVAGLYQRWQEGSTGPSHYCPVGAHCGQVLRRLDSSAPASTADQRTETTAAAIRKRLPYGFKVIRKCTK
eukprot:5688579-Pleurochrysis_carterae.AAC.7